MFTGDNGNARLRKYYRTLQEKTANAFGKQTVFIKEKASEKVNELKGGIEESITKARNYTFGSFEWDKWQTCNKVSQKADKILDETRKLGDALAGIQRIVNDTINYASDIKHYREEQIMRALEIQDPNVSKVLCQRNKFKENINETVLDGKTKLCDNYTNTWMRRVNCATTTFERKDFVKEEPQPPGIFQSVGKFVRNCFENVKEKVLPRNYCDSMLNGMQVGEQENDWRAPTRVLTIENNHDVPLELRRPMDNLALVDEMNQFAKESLNNLNEKMSKKLSTYLKSTRRQIRNTLAHVKAQSDDALKLILAGSDQSTSDKVFPNLDEWRAISVNNQYITAVVQSQQKFEANLKEISKTSQRALKNNRKDLKESILYASKELDELAVRLENLGGSVCVSLEDVRSSVLSLYSQVEDFGLECKNSMSEAIGECKGKVTEKAKTMAMDCKCNLIEMKAAVIEFGKAELVRHICTVNRKLEQKESDEEKRLDDPIEALYETLSICKSQIDQTREFKKKCVSKAKEGVSTYFNNIEETFIENVKEFKEKVDGLVQSASEQIESVMVDVSAAGGSIKKEIESVMVKTQEKVDVVKKKAVKVKDNVTKQVENAKMQFMEELNDAKRTAESYYANLNEHVQQIRDNFQKEWERCVEESNNDNEHCNCRDDKD